MPSPAIATTETSSDQRVERSDQSFVHSERTTRAERDARPTRRDGAVRRGAHRAAPTGVSSDVGAAWYSTESIVRRMNASSSDACSGASSCSTMPFAAASSPTASHEMPWSASAAASPSRRP